MPLVGKKTKNRGVLGGRCSEGRLDPCTRMPTPIQWVIYEGWMKAVKRRSTQKIKSRVKAWASR